MTDKTAMERADALLNTLKSINEHQGYLFTQPLMVTRESIAQAILEAEKRGMLKAADIAEEYQRFWVQDLGRCEPKLSPAHIAADIRARSEKP